MAVVVGAGWVGVSRALRDWAYDVIARNRYRWFGQRDGCVLPSAELELRLLGSQPGSTPPAGPDIVSA